MKFISFLLCLLPVLLFSTAHAAQEPLDSSAGEKQKAALKEFDDLGGNGPLYDKARLSNSETTMRVVQNRLMSRRNRIEIAPEMSTTLGGDAYVQTETIGINGSYHFNPHWSVGAKYAYAFNQLRPEGESLINDREISPTAVIPDSLDYLKSEYLALLNWYPFYGKINLFDLGVAHFDLYGIAGGGLVDLRSGSHGTYTAGLGLGFWIKQNFSIRTEMRYQSYNEQIYSGVRELKTTALSLQFGYLL